MKQVFVILCAMLLTACSNKQYHEAHHQILCNTRSDKAYLVSPGPGDTSFVRPVPDYDYLCKGTN